MAQTVTMMCALAVRGAFEAQILPTFETQSGIKVETFWAPTTVIIDRLAAGERADVVVVMVDAMDRLAEQGVIDPASRAEVAHSRLGVAVAAGAVHPEIGTEAAFIASLLAARSVAYSRGGASGIYFTKMIEKLGIADAINARATIIPQGFTAECLVSGAADLAVQQISELMVVPGVDIIGPFPDAVQNISSFSAAVTLGADAPAAAAALIASFITPQAAATYRAHGVDAAFD